MKGFSQAAVLTLAAGAALAGEWRVSRTIEGETQTPRVVSVPLDGHVFANSLPELADVRVLDQDGREVPRVILPERNYVFEARHAVREARIRKVETRADGGLAVECEIERTHAVSLTQLTIRTPLRDYEQAVTVYVPDARGGWRVVKAAEPLFDYSRFADVKKETVDLPKLTNRLYRLEIAQADDRVFSSYTSMTEEQKGAETTRHVFKRYQVERRPFRIDRVSFRDTEQVAVADEKRLDRVAVAGMILKEDRERKRTVMTVDTARAPVAGIALLPTQQNFDRPVTVEGAASGGWRVVGHGRVARVRLPGLKPEERLELTFPEVRTERLRITVGNDDNPPLNFGENGITLLLQRYLVAFIAEAGIRYRLVYGNADAAAPVYEQGVTAYIARGQKAAEWALSAAPQGNIPEGPAACAQRFLARHGIKVVSLIVMVALGLLILRAVRHT